MVLDTSPQAFTIRDLGVDGERNLPNGEGIATVDLVSRWELQGIAGGVDQNPAAPARVYPENIFITGQTGEADTTFNPSNYTFTYLTGDLVINPRRIEISADTQTKYYGDIDVLDTDTSAFTVVDLDAADPANAPLDADGCLLYTSDAADE